MSEEIDSKERGLSVLEGEHGHWETGVPGLKRRHVKSIRIDWDDHPPADIAEARLRDIFGALRKGFGGLDDMASDAELRLARTLDGAY